MGDCLPIQSLYLALEAQIRDSTIRSQTKQLNPSRKCLRDGLHVPEKCNLGQFKLHVRVQMDR